jgi:hypothetical protein
MVSPAGGKSWSKPVQVTLVHKAVHIVEILGGPPGFAYVAWQTDAPTAGCATCLRTYSISKAGLGPPTQRR